MRNKYDRQSSALEVGPSDLVYQNDGSPTPPLKTPSITEKEDQAVSARSTSLQNEFANILLRVAKHVDRRTSLTLVGLLADTFLDSKLLRWYIKSFSD